VKVLLNPDSNATPSPTTIKGHILKVLQVSVNTAIGMVRRSKSKPATAAAENGVTAEVEGKSSAAATSGKSSFSIMRLISKLREINSAPADDDEYADEAPIKAEEKSEPEKARSPFGIMEFIGKFISVKKSDESSSKSDDDEDHDGLLATIAAEINKEESDTDDDDVADAIARAESEIPEDLKEAQARAEDESKPGLVSGLLARFMPGQKAQQESDEDIIAEMSDDEAEAPGGLASLVGMLISRIRKSDDVAVEESKAVAASDDARPAASSVDKPEETETESDETTAEVSVDNADEGTEATDPVSESGEEAGADAGEPADGAESEVPADADAESEDTVAAKAADSPVDVDSPESNAMKSTIRRRRLTTRLRVHLLRLSSTKLKAIACLASMPFPWTRAKKSLARSLRRPSATRSPEQSASPPGDLNSKSDGQKLKVSSSQLQPHKLMSALGKIRPPKRAVVSRTPRKAGKSGCSESIWTLKCQWPR